MVRQCAAENLQESDDLDWKELPEPPRDGRFNELAKDVAAMANTRGGLLIFGVRDKTTELVGIDPDEVNASSTRSGSAMSPSTIVVVNLPPRPGLS